MSSILKSLKKLEEEKAGQKQGSVDVSRDILKGDIPRCKAKGTPVWPLLLLLVLLGVGGILLLRSPSPQPVATATAPTAEAKPAVAKVEPATQPPPATEGTGSPGAGTTLELVSASKETAEALKTTAAALQNTAAVLKDKVVVPREAVVVAPVAAKPKIAVKPAPAKEVETKAAVVQAEEKKIDLASVFPAPPPKVKPVPVPPEARDAVWSLNNRKGTTKPVLKVSEIHWRNDVRERLAVVNDLPVMEGVVIDGAKVDRIFKDRIRFVVNGQYQEVLLPAQR